MRAAGRLVKHFARLISSFRLTGDLRHYIALQHISQDETGMMMGLADMPRRIRDLADGHLPIVHRDVGKVVLEYGTVTRRAGLGLSADRGLGEQRESRG